jgi:uncharacterized circularly permuted ATP-grasp superfamily protein
MTTDIFRDYALVNGCHDELFDESNKPRAQYKTLFERLLELSADELEQRQQASDLSFLHQGITFTVYGDEQGTERTFPFDLLPRILTAHEWQTIEAGLTQRVTALNLFLHDIYHEGKILDDGILPYDMLASSKHFRREMRGVDVVNQVYIAICGTDLVRLPNGEFVVLEDNLRVPSGVSYMLANRHIAKSVFPKIFNNYGVRPIS